ncbi:MAG: hypothetical protein HY616_01120 [Candidatus Rokubacteria bacterium]|nr:hypothetical protein [Candidatus Rokubacteria bacterium]
MIGVLLALAVAPVVTAPAAAHHVGTYTPKDNAVTTNFKQMKFSVQAKKFDVALRLFETGALRATMRAQAATLPPGLEDGTRAALSAGAGAEVERLLMLFFVALARDLALEAERQLAASTASVEARTAMGQKFLEAIWRYYNLVDFAVSMRDSKTSAAVRLAFDEAEGYTRGTAAPAAINPCAGPRPTVGRAAPDPAKLCEPLRRIAQVLSTLIEAASTPARRNS